MKKVIFKRESFEDIKKVNEKYNSNRAILTEVYIEYIEEFDDGLGVKANGVIHIPFKVRTFNGQETHYKLQTISSSGLWGILSDDDEYISDIEVEQVDELMDYLKTLNVATDLYDSK